MASSNNNSNDFKGVSAWHPFPFGPGFSLTIFRIGVLLTAFGFYDHTYPSFLRISRLSPSCFPSESHSFALFSL
jgi:hypothetical protein